jgi:hypothetical protein
MIKIKKRQKGIHENNFLFDKKRVYSEINL